MDDDSRLDVLGQMSYLNLYTQLSLCYRVNDDSSYPTITDQLAAGLGRLSTYVPWLAGQIKSSSEDSSRVFRMIPYEASPRFVVRDVRHDPSMPTMETLRQSHFPSSMLHEDLVASHTTFQQGIAGSGPEPSVVFAVQATFIQRGLILTCVAHHQAMDMAGQGRIMHLLSRACRSESLSSHEISIANLPRYNLIPLLPADSCNAILELEHQISKPSSPSTGDRIDDASPPPLCNWAYFLFSASALSSLKCMAMETRSPQTDYISTDDALTALLWQSITRARLPRLEPTTKTMMTRAVDMRRYFDIHPDYPGMVQTLAYHKSTLAGLTDPKKTPLGRVASELRQTVQPGSPTSSNLIHDAKALATLITRGGEASTTAAVNPSSDVMISSWAKPDSYSLDFGLGLGTPEAVRRPVFVPVEGLVYLMPKRLDGEIAVMICLREEDIKRLREDEEFASFGVYIG